MSVAPPRRTARRGTRAASNEPTATPVAGPSDAPDDASVASTSRRSNRLRNRLASSGANAYGNRDLDSMVNHQTFQATQAQAVTGLENTLGQAPNGDTETIQNKKQLQGFRRLSEGTLAQINHPAPEVDERIPEEVRAEMGGQYDAQGIFYPDNTQDFLDDQLDTPAPQRIKTGFSFIVFTTEWIPRFWGRLTGANPASGDGLPADESHEWGDAQDLRSAGPSRRGSQPRTYGPGNERPFSHAPEPAAPRPESRAPSLSSIKWSPLRFLVKHALAILLFIVVMLNTIGMLDIYYGPLLGAKHDILPIRFRSLRPNEGQKPCAEGDPEEIRKIRDGVNKLYGFYKDLDTVVNRRPVPAIDYFSPHNGAEVWQKLTSPEKKRKRTGLKALFKKEQAFTNVQHIAAPFKDRKKMWCAPSDRGKAQVTVMMAAAMAPTELVVRQNLAMSEALDADTYPKELELWVDIKDDKAREAILAEVVKEFPDIMTKTEAQRDRKLADAQALPPTFIPLGRYLYDVNANQAVQGWPIKINIGHYDASTMRAAVRVSSNWGNYEATCLHEVSLYGDHKGERKVYMNPTKGEFVETIEINPLESMDCKYEEVDSYNGRGDREYMTVCYTTDPRTTAVRTMHPWGTGTA